MAPCHVAGALRHASHLEEKRNGHAATACGRRQDPVRRRREHAVSPAREHVPHLSVRSGAGREDMQARLAAHVDGTHAGGAPMSAARAAQW